MYHYIQALMENTVPFLLAWEAYVFFMLLFFLSIVIRLNRMEHKIQALLDHAGIEDYKDVPKRKEVIL
tara:strand:- start:403 stop:606 length:204 start_codon:yes stop_codon:yes gene_type:complete